MSLKLGSDVLVGPNHLPAKIRYIGKTKFATGTWIGVELSNRNDEGKNSGIVKGERYFRCRHNSGLFLRTASVQLASAMEDREEEEQEQEGEEDHEEVAKKTKAAKKKTTKTTLAEKKKAVLEARKKKVIETRLAKESKSKKTSPTGTMNKKKSALAERKKQAKELKEMKIAKMKEKAMAEAQKKRALLKERKQKALELRKKKKSMKSTTSKSRSSPQAGQKRSRSDMTKKSKSSTTSKTSPRSSPLSPKDSKKGINTVIAANRFGSDVLGEDILRTRKSGRSARDEINKLLQKTVEAEEKITIQPLPYTTPTTSDSKTIQSKHIKRNDTLTSAKFIPMLPQNMSSLGTNEEKSNAGDEGAGGTSGEGESGGIRHVIHRKGTMDAAMHVSLNQISENEDNQSGERLAIHHRKGTMDAAMLVSLNEISSNATDTQLNSQDTDSYRIVVDGIQDTNKVEDDDDDDDEEEVSVMTTDDVLALESLTTNNTNNTNGTTFTNSIDAISATTSNTSPTEAAPPPSPKKTTATTTTTSSIENDNFDTTTEKKENKKSKKERVIVGVRVRPLSKKQILKGTIDAWSTDRQTKTVTANSEAHIDNEKKRTTLRNRPLSYSYDYMWGGTAGPVTNEEIQSEVCDSLIHAAFNGYNSTIFAYGQTATGKTHTITGTFEDPGLLPRSVTAIFQIIQDSDDRDYLVRCTCPKIKKFLKKLEEFCNYRLYNFLSVSSFFLYIVFSKKYTFFQN